MKIIKIATTIDQNKRSIDKVDKEMKGLKKDIKDLQRDVKKAMKTIDDLNIGQRRFWQQRTVFTSLQRKIEKLEKVEQEWKKYKNEMDGHIRRQIEQRVRASV